MAIWDDLKANGKFDTPDSESISAVSEKCPNCGANLFFDSGHSALMCGNCGGQYDPETLGKTGSFGLSNPERDYDGKIEMSDDDKRRQEVVCNSCGAQIITDMNTSSTVCAFCGSPAIVTRRLTREFKPDYIIPFAFDKETAMSKLKEHASEIPHLPKGYINDQVLSKMTGIYVPAWIISSEVEVFLKGNAKVGKMVDEAYESTAAGSSVNNIDSYFRIIFGKAKFRLKDIPFDGEKKLPDRLMSAAEPFDFSELRPFSPEYLQGFFAEKYDEQPLDMTDKIYRRLDKYSLDICDELTFGYDKFTPNSNDCRTRYINQTVKYALLPIWFLSIENNGIRYQYIVNGQTGKVSGEFPYSKGWEKADRVKTKAKMNTITMNGILRTLLYCLPVLAICIVIPIMVFSGEFDYLEEHPTEGLLITILVVLLMIFLMGVLPKILLKAEKKGIADLAKDNSHELGKGQDYNQYFDTSFKMEAYETTSEFARLDTGWNYKEDQSFDFKTAMPEGEDIYDVKNDGTDFEKQGFGRRMME